MREKNELGFIVKQIANIYEKDFNEKLKRIGITSSQCAVLYHLLQSTKSEVNQRDIEKALNLRNPTVTGILKRMEKKGLVLIVQNSADQRKKNVHLTEKAYDIQKRMEAERRNSERKLVIGMSRKEKEVLHRMLSKVLYNIEEI